MGRLIGIDYGKVRSGIAVTDELQLIASGLKTVPTSGLLDELIAYASQEPIAGFVVGEPRQMNNQPSESEALIRPFIGQLEKAFPGIPIAREDERFTSKLAVKSMVTGGLKKKKRQDKALIDQISATLILQSYLNRK